ncbi:MAG TPA: hypothetical protein VHG51_14370 [Longimicrobiaceae bacterium]|nr:hypothetical protein [Longimicrobiaceae bacterium]
MNTPPATDSRSAVETLTRQRTRLQEWLARLGDVGPEVPAHVSERVRRDYEDRLRAVTEELAGHRDALAAELDDRRAELDEADALRASAADDLEEARLRHLIGELEDGEWEARRPELESALSGAEARAGEVRAEVERLDALLRDVGEPRDEPAAAPVEAAAEPDAEAGPDAEPWAAVEAAEEPLPVAESPLPYRDTSDDTIPEFTPYAADDRTGDDGGDEDLGVDLSWLEEVEQVSATATVEAGSPAAAGSAEAEATSEDDIAFLEELDRAISSSPRVAQAGAPPADGDRTLDPDRAGMLLCKECGAINEPQLWYCEICGSEL